MGFTLPAIFSTSTKSLSACISPRRSIASIQYSVNSGSLSWLASNIRLISLCKRVRNKSLRLTLTAACTRRLHVGRTCVKRSCNSGILKLSNSCVSRIAFSIYAANSCSSLILGRPNSRTICMLIRLCFTYWALCVDIFAILIQTGMPCFSKIACTAAVSN